MNTSILTNGDGVLLGGLVLLFAGILIGIASSGPRQAMPTVIVERQPYNSGGAGALLALGIASVIVIALVLRSL